ncbi:MAG TPA: hypothetical protein DHU72_00640 [Rikenellaceae bacterium]|mgnify:FL=1|nr:hypothetical protein [Rikenellaceae bacterium]
MSLKNRTIISLTCIIVLFATAAIFIASVNENKDKKSILAARLEAYCDAIYYSSLAPDRLPSRIQASIIRPDGAVIYDSRTDAGKMENHLQRPEIQKSITSGSGYCTRESSTSKSKYFYYAKNYGDKIIRCAQPYEVDLEQFFKLDWMLIISIGLLLILTLATIAILFKRFSTEAEDAAEAERRRLKHEMTANISHELKTPVSSIRGYLETLVNHPEIDDDNRQLFTERAYLQCLRLSDMIRDISLITKLEEAPQLFRTEPVNVKNTFNEVVEELSETLSAHSISVTNELPPVCVRGNYQLIYSIFRNLMENTAKYAGDGSSATITYSKDKDGIHHFDYHDNGHGVAPELLDRIFERFFRLDNDRSRTSEGSGLGLSIIKNAVIFHNGEITAYNAEGGGLGFRFSLKDLPL